MLSGKARRIAAVGLFVGACGALALALFGSPVGATPGGQSPAHQIYSDPQPASNGDFSGHGANTHGPYDSTRDGSPAMNGNGGGKGVGKPCAGCVGKADNKNPPGQMPGGSDGNAGYECDRNNGIGKGNPAHTSCTSGAPSSPPPSSPSDTLTPSTSPSSSGAGDTATPTATPPTNPTSSSGAPGETPTSPAPGDSSPVESQPGDAPVGVPSSGAAPLAAAQSALAAQAAQRASAQRLSNTGTPTAALLLIAGVCLVAGLSLLGMSYRRRSVR